MDLAFSMQKKWVDELPPYQGGGGMISEVKDEITFADSPTKFEAGTMQTAEVVAFAKSIKFIQDLGIKNINNHESQVLEYGLEKLKKIILLVLSETQITDPQLYLLQ